MLETTFGVGIIAFLLFYFAKSLEDEHFILKLFLIISAFTVLIFIPQSTGDTAFYKAFIWIYRIFWGYVFVYFVALVIQWLGISPFKDKKIEFKLTKND